MSRFSATSRYATTEQVEIERPDGTRVVYLRRRFLPQTDRFAEIGRHTVVDGERIDTLAADLLGDPTQWWRLADANGVADPDELVTPVGRVVRVTLPEGIPGVPDA